MRKETGDSGSGEHSDSEKNSEEGAEVGAEEVDDEEDVDNEGPFEESFIGFHGYLWLMNLDWLYTLLDKSEWSFL